MAISTTTVATDTLLMWAAGGAQMPNGDLLVAWERASTEPTNTGRIDAARSTDGGATWGASYTLVDTADLRDIEPQFLVIGSTVFFFYSTLDEGGGARTGHIYYKTSADNGNSWSVATEIPKGPEVTVATIQNPIIKTQSPNIGRIILPIQAVTDSTWYGSCIYSDDNCVNWTRGGNMTAGGKSLSEPTIVELSNGNLLAYLRNETDHVTQWKSISTDGGVTWSTAVDSGVQSPSAQSVLLRLANGHRILMWNNSTSSRIPLTVALSVDDCATWPNLNNIRTTGQWSNMGLFQLSNGNIVAIYSDEAGATFRLHIYATIFTESDLYVLDLQVAASGDDCFRRITPSYCSITELAMVVGSYDGSNYKYGAGLRFLNLTIPVGSIITTAYLTIKANGAGAGTVCYGRISAEKEDNPGVFTAVAGTFDTRFANHTTARVDWDAIPAWTGNVDYVSPEIKTVIQEIIDRAGWASGNALVIFLEDFDDRSTDGAFRTWYSYDLSATYCAKLHIEYASPVSASIYDTVNVSESITGAVISAGLSISTFDTVNVSEQVTPALLMATSIYDKVNVSEQISPYLVLLSSIYDTTAISGQVTPTLLLTFSTYDTVQISELVTPRLLLALGIYDTLTISESVTRILPLALSFYDTINTSESLIESLPLPLLLFDTIQVPESLAESLPLVISAYDIVNVSEQVTPNLFLTLSTFDTIQVTESIALFTVIEISLFDTVNLSESTIPTLLLSISAYDTVQVTELVSINLDLVLAIYDTVYVSEQITPELPLSLNVYDNVDLSELINQMLLMEVSAFDTVSISEQLVLALLLEMSIYDTVSVSEQLIFESLLIISIFDVVTTSEEVLGEIITLLLNISIFDTVNIFEMPTAELVLSIDVYESVAILGEITPEVLLALIAYDTVQVDEFIDITPTFGTSVYDTVDISEQVIPGLLIETVIYDTVSSPEQIVPGLLIDMSAYDVVAVSEIIGLELPLSDSIYDTMDIGEQITPMLLMTASLYDTIDISELAEAATDTLAISIYDTIHVDAQYMPYQPTWKEQQIQAEIAALRAEIAALPEATPHAHFRI
jgi:hypothetical protein